MEHCATLSALHKRQKMMFAVTTYGLGILKGTHLTRGSDATAASGGKRELSEWQRSVGNAGASSPRRTPGTATGQCLFASVCGARQPLRLTKQASVLPTAAFTCPLASSAAGSARARNP